MIVGFMTAILSTSGPRYFRIGDITIEMVSELPLREDTFHPKFKIFEVSGPGEDTIRFEHFFRLPDLQESDLGREVYRHPPWAIYDREDNGWLYVGISPSTWASRLFRRNGRPHRVMFVTGDHSTFRIHNPDERIFKQGNLTSLSMCPTDQILLAPLLVDRESLFLHASGVVHRGRSILFAGPSGAGKSTISTLFRGHAEILCDDRIILRNRGQDGWWAYGTWSHGDVPDVSAASAPLAAVCFLEQSSHNALTRIEGRWTLSQRLLENLVRPFVTRRWWNKTLDLLLLLADEVPCYVLRFDRSGKVIEVLEDL